MMSPILIVSLDVSVRVLPEIESRLGAGVRLDVERLTEDRPSDCVELNALVDPI